MFGRLWVYQVGSFGDRKVGVFAKNSEGISGHVQELELDEVEDADELDPVEDDELDWLGELDELGVVEEDEALLSPPLFGDALSPLDLVSESPLPSVAVVELFTSVFSPLFSDLASGSLSLSE